MMAFALKSVCVVGVCAVLAGCGAVYPRAQSEPVVASMRWDHVPDSARWTRASLSALQDQGQELLSLVPRDIDVWCPAYRDADEMQRALFWTGMMSALAKHESTWNPKAVGGNGQWFGLLQIAPATARAYDCDATSASALSHGAANLSCAVRIMATTVPRDGVVSEGMGGVAADWGPFHSEAKRTDMKAWVSSQSYCAA